MRTCAHCRRRFALEPKANSLHLHDLRVRTLAERLSDPGQAGAPPLRYTADQLRMAASRKVLANPDGSSAWLGCMGPVTLFGVFVGFFALVAQLGELFVAVVLVVFWVVVICLIGHVATARRRRLSGEPMSASAFTLWVLDPWVEVYGVQPPGLLPPRPVVDVLPPGPPAALLYCPDPGTIDFLTASGIVDRRGVALIVQGREWPPAALLAADRAVPVLVLHHADAAGCLVVPRVRAALPAGTRVIDAGLRPRVAERLGPPVRLPPDRSLLRELARTGSVDAAEQAWLARGNTLPLAAVRPARLLAAVERALPDGDPDEARAEAVGFMAWPEPAA
ncbi:hypothetical protein [Pseudonocardia adelaidensis]